MDGIYFGPTKVPVQVLKAYKYMPYRYMEPQLQFFAKPCDVLEGLGFRVP